MDKWFAWLDFLLCNTDNFVSQSALKSGYLHIPFLVEVWQTAPVELHSFFVGSLFCVSLQERMQVVGVDQG